MPIPLLAIAALALGAGTAIAGASKNRKANQMDAANQRPEYRIPQYEYDNQRLLESRASQGLGDNTLVRQQQFSDRAMSAALNTILQSGGNSGDVANLVTRNFDSIDRLSIANDAAQLRNIDNLVQQNRRMSEMEDKRFQVNEFAPYLDARQRAAQMRTQGQNMMWQGIGQAAGGVGMLGSSLAQAAQLRGVNRTSAPNATVSNNYTYNPNTNSWVDYGVNSAFMQNMSATDRQAYLDILMNNYNPQY